MYLGLYKEPFVLVLVIKVKIFSSSLFYYSFPSAFLLKEKPCFKQLMPPKIIAGVIIRPIDKAVQLNKIP